MVKAYLVHRLLDTFGVVASPRCNTEVHPHLEVCFSGGNEAVCVWDLRKSTTARKLIAVDDAFDSVSKYDSVTRLLAWVPSTDGSPLIFAGYSNGDIRLWNWQSGISLSRFRGHRGPVTCLVQSLDGALLASGGADHEVFLWNMFVGQALFRLTGHVQAVTAVTFLYPVKSATARFTRFSTSPKFLISGGLDGQLRLWHLDTQRCLQMVMTHSTAAVQTMVLMPDQQHLLVGLSSKNIEVFRIKRREDVSQNEEVSVFSDEAEFVLVFAGVLQRRSSSKRVASMTILGCPAPDDGIPACEAEFKSHVRLPNGSYLAGDSTTLHVPDQKRLIFVASFSQHLEVIRAQDGLGRRRREIRLLLRRVDKLKKKSSKLEEGAVVDSQLRELLGSDWRSALSNWETLELTRLSHSISLLRDIVAERKLNFLSEDSSMGAQIENSSVSTASMTFRMMTERFDLLGKAVSLSAGSLLVVGVAQNHIESYRLNVEAFFEADEEQSDVSLMQRTTRSRSRVGGQESLVDVPSHLSLSHDGSTLVSMSSGQLALWDVVTRLCRLRIGPSNVDVSKSFKPLSGFFLPGDEYIICGDHQGVLSLFHLPTITKTEEKLAHAGSVAAMDLHPNMTLFATAGSDKKLRLHRFRLNKSNEAISIKSVNETELPDTPNDIKFSPDGTYIAVALASNTIQILFADSLKIYLTLYGHSLPVLSVAWSSDSQMLASGSLDRHLKIWDTEFGNILRSIPATRSGHVTRVLFVNQTHYVVSALSTGEVKLWDVDEGERIVTLTGAPVEIVSLAASRDTELIFGGCADRSIRVWERTDEQFFLTEERERESHAATLLNAERGDQSLPSAASMTIVTAARPSRKDVEVVRNTEMLIDVIQEAEEERIQFDGYRAAMAEYERSSFQAAMPVPPRPLAKPELMGRSPQQHVLAALSTLTRENMTEVLLGLPFPLALHLLRYMCEALEEICKCIDGDGAAFSTLHMTDAEVVNRTIATLTHAHRRFLSTAVEHRALLERLREYTKRTIDYELLVLRRNTVAMSFLAKSIHL